MQMEYCTRVIFGIFSISGVMRCCCAILRKNLPASTKHQNRTVRAVYSFAQTPREAGSSEVIAHVTLTFKWLFTVVDFVVSPFFRTTFQRNEPKQRQQKAHRNL